MGTNLTMVGITRASVLVLETSTLYCVCKSIFLNHDDSLCKNGNCLFVQLGFFKCIAKKKFLTIETISDFFPPTEMGRDKFNA